jgi:hypothetical protein
VPSKCGFNIWTELHTDGEVRILKLWNLHSLLSVESVGDLHSRVPQVLHFLSLGDAVPVVETYYRLDYVDQGNIERIPVKQYQLNCYIN